MIGEKLINSLILLSSKLLSETTTDELVCLNEDLDLIIQNEKATTFMFVQLSLDLFTRFNDASANNSILTSLNHIKSSTHLLGELCSCLNNKSTPIQLYYIKYLIRLFRINFKNNNTQSISNSQISNSLFQTQFEIINSWLDDNNANTVHKLVIEYLYQYSSLLGLKQQQQSINSFSLFKGLIVLLNQTLKFISTYLTDGKLCDCLIDIINEINHFKTVYEHTQQCLRNKHTHLSCKSDLTNSNICKHTNITNNDNNECVLAKFFLCLIKNESCNSKLTLYKKLELVNRIGICSCIRLDYLLDCLISNNETYSYLDDLSSIVCEYLSLISLDDNQTNDQKPRRQSTFYSLLADELLINNNRDKNNLLKKREFTLKNNKFFKIIQRFDKKSVLLSKYLSSFLKKFSKYIPPAELHQKTEQELISENSQFESFKYITFEIFYLYVKVLKFLLIKQSKSDTANECLSSNDEDLRTNNTNDFSIDNKEEAINLCEIIFKYLNDFLLINNSYLLNKEPDSPDTKVKTSRSFFSLSNTESNTELDFKLITNFIQYINRNSVKLNKLIIVLCHQFKMPLNISFCSQLILFQELNNKTKSTNSIEQTLCKSIIDEMNINNIKENSFILEILLELYLKSSMFRFALNDQVNIFHSILIESLNDFFEKNNENNVYVELLLDLIFVYFYFNRKVFLIYLLIIDRMILINFKIERFK